MSPRYLHFTRRAVISPLWLWAWLWMLRTGEGVGTGAGRRATVQDFPIAAEENFYSFNPDGTYTFSYDTGDGQHQSFRIEMRDASGRVSGRFGYVDPDGALRITEYQADSEGYRASIEVYHQVNLAPPAPLLVGPLPKSPPSPPELPDLPEVRPIGPAAFFPPQEPLLIIGPLPKPLQPLLPESDEDLPELDEDVLFSLSSDPEVLPVLPQSPMGEPSPQEGPQQTLVDILQGTISDILQEPSEDLDITPSLQTSSVTLGDKNNQTVPLELGIDNLQNQTGVTNTAQDGQQSSEPWDTGVPSLPPIHDSKKSSSGNPVEDKEITLSQANPRKQFNIHNVTFTVNPRSIPYKQTSSQLTDSLLPTATTTVTSTVTRLAERDTMIMSTKQRSSSSLLEERKIMQSRTPPYVPPLTYLPVWRH